MGEKEGTNKIDTYTVIPGGGVSETLKKNHAFE